MLKTERSRGLDTLRASAISLVFMHHYMSFVSHRPTFGWLGIVGWSGVDLFFVLSGYLIGNQLFSGIARGQRLDTQAFYARRALRTWPAFWVVLSAYFLFPASMGGDTPPALWRFLTFTQNIGLHPGTALSHAWSLCIEEQFYLLVPLVLWLCVRTKAPRFYTWALFLGLLCLGIVSRIVRWKSYAAAGMHTADDYYPNIYYSTLCRFDEFLPGLAVAMIKNYHPTLWTRLTRRGQSLLVTGSIATGSMLFLLYRYYHIDHYGYGFCMTAFGYSLLSLSFAVLVLAALSPTSLLYRLRIPGAYHIALWSYSTYLSHKAVFNVVGAYSERLHLSGALTLIIATVTSIACGALLYWLIETPFMVLRDRLFPALFHERERVSVAAREIA